MTNQRVFTRAGALLAAGLMLGLASLLARPWLTSASSQAGQEATKQVPRVSVEELQKLVADKKVVIVDVRAVEAYKAGHIKDAVSLPFDKIEAGDFKDLPRDKRIITYCSCPAENSSAVAAVMLGKAGFKDVGTLLGGTAAWEKAGGEMVKGKPAGKP